MKHKNFKILLLIFLISKFGFAQVLTYQTEYDLGNDGSIEKLQFFDKFAGEYEKTEFTSLCIINGDDTISVENNDDVWVINPNLISYTDEVIDDRIGVIKCNEKCYLLLTSFQYGCCLNKTTIYEWTGTSLKEIFDQDFEVGKTPVIDSNRYLVGNYTFSESYGDEKSDFYFISFFPTEYRLFSDSLKVDKKITQEKNQIYPTIENTVDVYSAVLVKVNVTNQTFMISQKLEKSLRDREFGIISLVKLTDEYFQKLDKNKLRIMRNELFAYHGYSFRSQDLKKYFETKPWYKPTDKTSTDIVGEFSDIEKYNIDKIIKVEKTVGNNL